MGARCLSSDSAFWKYSKSVTKALILALETMAPWSNSEPSAAAKVTSSVDGSSPSMTWRLAWQSQG
eukprot:1264349-Pleurochrysis_carterae.AAC.1